MLAIGLSLAAQPAVTNAPSGAGAISSLLRPSKAVLSAGSASPTDAVGDTLHVDLEAFNNAVGLTAGGTFYTAARLTPVKACTVTACIWFRWNRPSNNYLFVWAGNTATQPGAIIESVPFTAPDSGWQTTTLLTPVPLDSGDDIWIGPRMSHSAGTYPLGVDDGPHAATRGDWINYRGSWEELYSAAGLDVNWHIRAILGSGHLPDHDVGVLSIVAPPPQMNQGSINPIVRLRNYGANPESDIPVTCWIDSLGTRVYTGTDTLAGPLAAGATANDTFPTLWSSGPAGAQYTVTMFTGLSGDMDLSNDTMVGSTQITGAVFSDTIHVRRLAKGAPTIDGVISPGEWLGSIEYDISDLAGRGGSGAQPAGSVLAYYLYDPAAGRMYFAVDCPNYTGRTDYDQFGAYMDEDRSLTWATDSSEGNYWVEYVGGDSVIYRALLDVTPNVWLYGLVPGAVSVSSTTSGHLQFETRVPLGTEKYQLSIAPGDTVGYFQYVAVSGGSVYPGWWPQTLLNANWANPHYYGTMIFESQVGVHESPSEEFTLYKASPSLVRDLARISYSVTRTARVELGIYDVTGKLVRTLVNGTVEPGSQNVTWNRTDNDGTRVANGTYFYRLTVDGKSVSGKAIVLK
jgi:hypothetical protein